MSYTEVYCTGRAAGKTTQAIKKCAETGAYMVVANREEADHVIRMAREMGLESKMRYPITFADLYENRMKGSRVRNVVIDNADWFLQMWLSQERLRLEMITVTGGEQPKWEKTT